MESWHEFLAGRLEGGLDAILADDVVFYSPILFKPAQGKELTRLYLTAAYTTFGGDIHANAGAGGGLPSFRYTKQVLTDPHAILEFETEVDGKLVNGVDIITCDDAGKIVEFRVMVRPLQAVNLMHQKMAAMLETLRGAGADGKA